MDTFLRVQEELLQVSAAVSGHNDPDLELNSLLSTLRTPLPATVRIRIDLEDSEKESLGLLLSKWGWRPREDLCRLLNTWTDSLPPTIWSCDAEMMTNSFRKRMIPLYQCKSLRFQEVVSMLPAYLLTCLSLKVGTNVDERDSILFLDLCAAPASKTGFFSESYSYFASVNERKGCLLPPKLLILANDSDFVRCNLLETHLQHLSGHLTTCADAGRYPTFIQDPESKSSVLFDLILADVPCSGDGTARKNPTILEMWDSKYSMKLFRKQEKILCRGLSLLRLGGYLVYSTCSLNPLENEAVVQSALLKYQGQIELVDPSDLMKSLGKYVPGVTSWSLVDNNKSGDVSVYSNWADVPQEKRVPQGIWRESMFGRNMKELKRCIRIHPNHTNTGGFFLCVFQRKAYYHPADNDCPSKRIMDSSSGRPKLSKDQVDTESASQERTSHSMWIHPRNVSYLAVEELEDFQEEWQSICNFFGLTISNNMRVICQVKKGEVKRVNIVDRNLFESVFCTSAAGKRHLHCIGLGVVLFKPLKPTFLTFARVRWEFTPFASELLRAGAINIHNRILHLHDASLLSSFSSTKSFAISYLEELSRERIVDSNDSMRFSGIPSCNDEVGSVLLHFDVEDMPDVSTEWRKVWVPYVITGRQMILRARKQDIHLPYSAYID